MSSKFIAIEIDMDYDHINEVIIKKIFDSEKEAMDYYDDLKEKQDNSLETKKEYIDKYVNDLIEPHKLKTVADLHNYLKNYCGYNGCMGYGDYDYLLESYKIYLCNNTALDAMLVNYNPPKVYWMGNLYIKELKEEDE